MQTDYGLYAPVNAEKDNTFFVSYVNEGAEFVTEGRREKALQKMWDHCKGEYVLINTANTGGPGEPSPYGGYKSAVVHFHFRCVES